MVFNDLNDLKNFIIGEVFPNNSFQTGSQNIQNIGISLAESLWNRAVENSTVGTLNPVGNVVPNNLGAFYLKEDENPKQLYYATIDGDATSWIQLNKEVSSGNGITVGPSGTVDVGDYTSSVTRQGNDTSVQEMGFATRRWRAETSGSPGNYGEIYLFPNGTTVSGGDTSGNSFQRGSNPGGLQDTTNFSTGASAQQIQSPSSHLLAYNDGLGGSSTVDLDSDGVNIGSSNAKGAYTNDQSGIDWESGADDTYLPSIGTIKANINSTAFIENIENVLVVHGTSSADNWVDQNIVLANNVGTFYELKYSGTPSTDHWIQSFDVKIDTTGASKGDYIIVDFVNNYGSGKVTINGSFAYHLSQNATYLITFDAPGAEPMKYTMIGPPKPMTLRGNRGTNYIGPGVYYMRAGDVYLPDIGDVLLGESVEIIQPTGSNPTVNPFGANSLDDLWKSAINERLKITAAFQPSVGLRWLL